jgi:uncharacterized protein YbaP (TraB family)
VKNIVYKSIFGIAVIAGCIWPENCLMAASVWKVSDSSGKVLYLGGSIHALRPTDYPLPPEYARAFDASNRLAFEIDPKEMGAAGKSLVKAGEYPSGDTLKKHVDPRTYDYVRRFFAALNVPESKFAKFRPWFLAAMLQAPQLHGLSPDLGVEGFLKKRAGAKSKPISGLETMEESVRTISGLSDRQAEAMLLISFIPGSRSTGDQMTTAWRKGDADRLWAIASGMLADVPSIADRMITRRNHNWLPKIDAFMKNDQTYFVVVGAGHMGGPDGLLTLLRQRGYKIEQL